MQCKICNQDLKIAKSKPVSDVESTDVYMELTMVCINPKCANYAGSDLINPAKVAETVRNKWE